MRDIDVYLSRACFQGFPAMTVSAVCCSRFGSGSMVISPITQCFIKLCVETALQELRYRFPEQPLDILYTSNVRVAQQLSDQLSSCLFLRCSFSANFFSSIRLLLLYTVYGVYTRFGVVSHTFAAGVVMTSASGAVHALLYSILVQRSSV